MENCNESEPQSVAGPHSTDAATLTGASATVIEPATAPSQKPQTELIEVPAPAMASVVSPLENEKTGGSKTVGLETPPSKPAVEPALRNTKAGVSETEAKASPAALEPAKPP